MKDRTYREHGEEINQLAWHPTVSNYVATASGDRLVKIFDTRTDRSNATIETKGKANSSRCFINYLVVN